MAKNLVDSTGATILTEDQKKRQKEMDDMAATLAGGRAAESAWVDPQNPRITRENNPAMSTEVTTANPAWTPNKVDPKNPAWETDSRAPWITPGNPAWQTEKHAPWVTKENPAWESEATGPRGPYSNIVSPPPFGGSIGGEDSNVLGGVDFNAAFGGQKGALEGFYGQGYQGVLDAQQEVIDVRAAQNTNIQDLEAAQAKWELDMAVQDLEAARAERVKIEAEFLRIEDNVAREMGGAGTASQVRAEVNNRIKQLKPAYDEVLLRESSAIANINTRNALVEQRFNASRADATEMVNRSMQKLGFKEANIDAAFKMMSNMQTFQMNSDAIVTKKQQQARADFSVYHTVPGYIKGLKPEQRRQLEKDAGFMPGFYDFVAEMPLASQQGIDTASGYYYAVYPDAQGTGVTIASERAFTPVSSYSSASREADLDLSQTSDIFQETWRNEVAVVSATAANSKDDPSAYTQAKYIAIGELSKVMDPKNDAERHQVEKFKNIWPDSGVTSADLVTIDKLLNQ